MRKISKKDLCTWDAPVELVNWFDTKYQSSSAIYQELLDGLAKDDLPELADWLIDQAGFDGSSPPPLITGTNHIFSAGNLRLVGSVRLYGRIRSKGDIQVNGDLYASETICCSGDLRSTGNVHSDVALVVGGTIVADGTVSSKYGIRASSITTPKDIKVKVGSIDATRDIQAGGIIFVHDDIRVCNITCQQELITGGDIIIRGAIKSASDVIVGGRLSTLGMSNHADIFASGKVHVNDDLSCGGSVHAESIYVGGNLAATQGLFAVSAIQVDQAIDSQGSIVCRTGSISAGDEIKARGLIQAGTTIATPSGISALPSGLANGEIELPTGKRRIDAIIASSQKPDAIKVGTWVPVNEYSRYELAAPSHSTEATAQVPSVKIVGIGHYGCEEVRRLKDSLGNTGPIEFIAADTDATALGNYPTLRTIQLGKSGISAGQDTFYACHAAHASAEAIRSAVKDTQLVFVITDLNDGTGCGASPEIAKISRETGALTITLLGSDTKTRDNPGYQDKVETFRTYTDALFLLTTEAVEESSSSGQEALQIVDSLTKAVFQKDYFGADLSHIRKVFTQSGLNSLSSFSTSGDDRIKTAVKNKLTYQTHGLNSLEQANRIFIGINGSSDLQLDKANSVVELIKEIAKIDAYIVVSINIDKIPKSSLQITIIANSKKPYYAPDYLANINHGNL